MSEFCCVYFRSRGRRCQVNTEANSVFDAVWKAIEFTHGSNWMGPHPRKDGVLEVRVGKSHEKGMFRVGAARVVEHFGQKPEDWLET